MKLIQIFVLTTLVVFLSACGFLGKALSEINAHPGGKTLVGSGMLKMEERPVRAFHAVDMQGFGTLIITQGERETLVVEAEDNLLPYFTTEVRGGCLYIRTRPLFSFQSSQPIRFHLTVRSLDTLRVGGFAKVEADMLAVEALHLQLSDYGQAQFKQVRLEQFSARLSDFAQLVAQGTASSQDVVLGAYSQYHASGLESQTARARLGGSSQAALQVRRELKAHLKGAASLVYSGSPQVSRVVARSARMEATE